MSWIEQIQTEMIITTGDGRQYSPLWVGTSREKQFNIAQFNYPNIAGTFVDRTTPQGAVYALDIRFQNEDHLQQAQAFWESADNSAPWTLEHPQYGSVTVQPVGLTFNDSDLNVTRITGQIIETLLDDAPEAVDDPAGEVRESTEQLSEAGAEGFADTQPDASDISQLQSSNRLAYDAGARNVPADFAQEYFNLFNRANAAAASATTKPAQAMSVTQRLLQAPAGFTANVERRLDILTTQAAELRRSLAGIASPNNKRIYERQAASVVSAMALTVTTPRGGDYDKRRSVVRAGEIIITAFNQYVADLGNLQTESGYGLESYIPESGLQRTLRGLISFATAHLFRLAFAARQERTVILQHDSNVILQAHKYYGSDATDERLEAFIEQNEIGPSEIFILKAGRAIKYYV